MRDLPSPRAPLIFLVFLGSRLSCCCLTNFSLPLVLLHVAAQFSPAELRCSIFAAAWPMDLFIHIGAHPYTSSFSFLSSAVRCSVPMPEPIACQWRLWFSTRLHLILVASLCAASLRVWSRFLSPGACLLVESAVLAAEILLSSLVSLTTARVSQAFMFQSLCCSVWFTTELYSWCCEATSIVLKSPDQRLEFFQVRGDFSDTLTRCSIKCV
jgi:hypothetical protein